MVFWSWETATFYAPGLKNPPGASSVWIVRAFVCLSVCPSFCNSVPLMNKVQYLKFGWSYSYKTWTVSSPISKGCSHFTDITCPWGWGGVKMQDLERFLPYFDFVAAGGIRVSQTHVLLQYGWYIANSNIDTEHFIIRINLMLTEF